MRDAVKVSGANPVLIDSYLRDAIEVDVDALADKDQNVFVAGIMEHIEEAGIHSGDSACSLPPYSLPAKIIAEIERQTEAMAKALQVVGLMNVQYAVKDGEVYVLEVNPRASRTVPFVAKATGQPIAKYRRPPDGRRIAEVARHQEGASGKHVAVKEAVFPFARFPGVDVILGPEMRSTGEVMGLDSDFGRAFAKSQLGAGSKVPVDGVVFVSVKDPDKAAMVKPVKRLVELGFKVVATGGTADFLRQHGIDGAARQQGARRPAAHRRPDEGRQGPAGLQHRRRRGGADRQLHAAAHRADAQDRLLHHGRRRQGLGRRHRGAERRGVGRGAPAILLQDHLLASEPKSRAPLRRGLMGRVGR